MSKTDTVIFIYYTIIVWYILLQSTLKLTEMNRFCSTLGKTMVIF